VLCTKLTLLFGFDRTPIDTNAIPLKGSVYSLRFGLILFEAFFDIVVNCVVESETNLMMFISCFHRTKLNSAAADRSIRKL